MYEALPNVYESMRPDVEDYSPAALPDYAGDYSRKHLNNFHVRTDYANLNPAPGSVDLIAPRNTGGMLGINETWIIGGPVTGEITNYANENTDIPWQNSNPQGPNAGGQDYNTGRLLAYEASQLQALTQAESAQAISYPTY